jgi:hypothetical protein
MAGDRISAGEASQIVTVAAPCVEALAGSRVDSPQILNEVRGGRDYLSGSVPLGNLVRGAMATQTQNAPCSNNPKTAGGPTSR